MARPARKLHLECRDGSWRVTVKVPADCRAIIGKANLIHTFGKIPYSKAAALHDEIYEGFLERITNARTGTLTPDDDEISPRYYPPRPHGGVRVSPNTHRLRTAASGSGRQKQSQRISRSASPRFSTC